MAVGVLGPIRDQLCHLVVLIIVFYLAMVVSLVSTMTHKTQLWFGVHVLTTYLQAPMMVHNGKGAVVCTIKAFTEPSADLACVMDNQCKLFYSHIHTATDHRSKGKTTRCWTRYLGPPCDPPSALILDLGCVTPVATYMTWSEAKDHCLAMGSEFRLLEGITSQQEIDLMSVKFKTYLEGYPWIGSLANPWRWLESGVPLAAPSPLWFGSDPDNGNDACGFLVFATTNGIADIACTKLRPCLCQRK